MQYQDGKIYVLDEARRDVATMNLEFSDFSLIGKPGEGPGELARPVGLYVEKDTVYILDGGTVSVKNMLIQNLYPLFLSLLQTRIVFL